MFGSKKRAEQEKLLLAQENDVFRIEDIHYLYGYDLVSLGGRMLKGAVSVGDRLLSGGTEYEIAGIKSGVAPISEAAQDVYCCLVIRYKTTGVCKAVFRLGAVKILRRETRGARSAAAEGQAWQPTQNDPRREPGNRPPAAMKSPAAQPAVTDVAVTAPPDRYLDDISYIQSMKHIITAPWHRYDVVLDARGYGWDMMIDWADYMILSDLEHISQVTCGLMGTQGKDVTASFSASGAACGRTPELAVETGTLSVAGVSRNAQSPMKIVWFNQTNVLRLFTLCGDELLMSEYVETMVRRTFGTPNAMKLGKPHPRG